MFSDYLNKLSSIYIAIKLNSIGHFIGFFFLSKEDIFSIVVSFSLTYFSYFLCFLGIKTKEKKNCNIHINYEILFNTC